jgi:hydroxyacyl-ACP dehydratase HTD2-like protein with hotdog domain
LQARKLPILYDDLTTRATHNLNVSLATFVPDPWLPNSTFEDGLPQASPSFDLPPSHHLVYFNPALPPSKLLPDGTDPNQSPGSPFVRRMWAGGNVRWKTPLKVDGSRYACVEGIRDVTIKGKPGQEKVFVGIERRIGAVGNNFEEADIRRKLWAEREEEFGEADLVERRNIVFMYEKSEEELEKVRRRGAGVLKEKMLKREFGSPWGVFLCVLEILIFDLLQHNMNLLSHIP